MNQLILLLPSSSSQLPSLPASIACALHITGISPSGREPSVQPLLLPIRKSVIESRGYRVSMRRAEIYETPIDFQPSYSPSFAPPTASPPTACESLTVRSAAPTRASGSPTTPGFFAKEGLEDQIILIPSATQLAQVTVAGDVDIASLGGGPMMAAVAQRRGFESHSATTSTR